jgi:putative membrane protein insertion efficiency factor
VNRAAIALVLAYQRLVSPLLPRPAGGRCKYHPSCSQYAIDALREFGLLRGLLLAAWRLLRCNPWSRGGVDHARDARLFRRAALPLEPR